MAHELTIRENGFVETAWTGDRSKIWHLQGQQLSENSSIEEWKVQSGLDWDILGSPISFQGNGDRTIFPSKKALYRSDTVAPLSIVGSDYKIVQPGEVLEFFRDLVENHGMKLSAAGSLYGGKKFWATAEVGKSEEITSGDVVEGFLLLTTSADGTLATTAKFSSVRTVCNNTLNIALNGSGNLVKVSHKSIFDASQVKIDLGLIDTGWNNFVKDLRNFSNQEISPSFAKSFIFDLVMNKKLEVNEQPDSVHDITANIMSKFRNGIGNEGKTSWDLLNGITEFYTHEKGRTRTTDALFWNNFYGSQAKMKSDAYDSLLLAA